MKYSSACVALALSLSFLVTPSYAGEDTFLDFLNFSNLKKEKKVEKVDVKSKAEDPHKKMIREADSGDLNAQLSLGYIFLYGEGEIKKDYKKAFHYYKMAANQNDSVAINNLGSLYYSGIGTQRNVAKAMAMFEKASSMDNVEASVNLAFLYMTENPIAKDNRKALELFKKAAETQNPTAQFMLGYAYLHGYLVAKDEIKAFSLLKASALAKYDEAQYQTARLYMQGRGTPQNYGKAVSFLKMAVRQGHSNAMVTLARIVAEGKKYPQDLYLAHILFNLASVRGHAEIGSIRDEIGSKMQIQKVLNAQAEADAFRDTPSELTSYIHQTFGTNIKGYIDRYLPQDKKMIPDGSQDKSNTKEPKKTTLL